MTRRKGREEFFRLEVEVPLPLYKEFETHLKKEGFVTVSAKVRSLIIDDLNKPKRMLDEKKVENDG